MRVRSRCACWGWALIALVSLSCCRVCHGPESPPHGDSELALAAAWLAGDFSSAEQAATDSLYRDIRLHMAPIWPERTDGRWLYVEQLVAGQVPYRQRVYHLHRASPETIASVVYTLPGEKRFVGAWSRSDAFAGLTPDSLEEREGCTIVLRRQDERTFVGATLGRGCASTLRGAAYATSEVTLRQDVLISWDRGFNEAGEQVWGAEGGGYVFKRIPHAGS